MNKKKRNSDLPEAKEINLSLPINSTIFFETNIEVDPKLNKLKELTELYKYKSVNNTTKKAKTNNGNIIYDIKDFIRLLISNFIKKNQMIILMKKLNILKNIIIY